MWSFQFFKSISGLMPRSRMGKPGVTFCPGGMRPVLAGECPRFLRLLSRLSLALTRGLCIY